MSRLWLLVTVPVAGAAVGLLIATARRLVRAVRRAVVARVPVRAEQPVAFAESGAFTLSVEARRWARELRGLTFALVDARDGARVPLRPVVLRAEVASWSRVRREVARFALDAPGTYVLAVGGAAREEAAGRDGLAVVFARPVGAAIVGHVLALVGLGFVLIAALVGTGVVVAGGAGAVTAATSSSP